MRTSIVIPALNEAVGIRQTVKCACALNPHEIIVVDGGSNDGTAAIVRESGCMVLESRPGRALQQNCGARQATGDVLLFLHADCRLHSGALNQIAKAFDDPNTGAGAFRQQIAASGFLYRLLERGNGLRVRCFSLPFGDQGIFVRRQLFFEVGGFPEVRLMEDLLLMRKLRRRTRVALLPGPICTSARRWEKHGVISQTARNWCLLTAEKLGVSPDRLADFYRLHQDVQLPPQPVEPQPHGRVTE